MVRKHLKRLTPHGGYHAQEEGQREDKGKECHAAGSRGEGSGVECGGNDVWGKNYRDNWHNAQYTSGVGSVLDMKCRPKV